MTSDDSCSPAGMVETQCIHEMYNYDTVKVIQLHNNMLTSNAMMLLQIHSPITEV